MKHSRLFITGTDTGVGKTFVTAALARRARSLGRSVFAFKPIETGCTGEGSDQRELCAAAGDWQTGRLRGLHMFEDPVAPWVAAGDDRIDVAEIVDVSRSQTVDVTLVEGAGGWRVPITSTVDMSGLAQALGFPVVVVSRATLGTINHSLLTAEAVERDGCQIAALVLSVHPQDSRMFAEDNARRIRARWAGRCVLYTGDPTVFDVLLGSG